MTEQNETKTARNAISTGVTVTPEQKEQIAKLAEQREWSFAKAGGFLIRLGLEKLANEQPAEREQVAA